MNEKQGGVLCDHYKVVCLKGDYWDRQQKANRLGADLFLAQHFNSAVKFPFRPYPNYALSVVARNASRTSREIGYHYAHACEAAFDIPVGYGDGLKVGGRGTRQILYTDMPAVILEPLFCSSPVGATVLKSDAGQTQLAAILVETVRAFLPAGSLIALSVGHKFQRRRTRDRGAKVYGGGWEADFAEIVLKRTATTLKGE